MYEFEKEIQRKEKLYKAYIILFIVTVLINIVLFFINGETLRGISGLLFFIIVLNFGLRKKAWAVSTIKFLVWINILALIFFMVYKAINTINNLFN